ncbi:recombinase family protein [Erwinia sp.]|uniref:recombinase family protein n=1 Tax=Erwinia citreus TaxID=558 RepID=UPI003C7241DE
MKLAIPYVRYSSAEQATGDSLRRQRKLIDAWSVTHPDYTLSNEIYKDEGLSAYHGKHADGDLGRLTDNIINGSIPPGSVILLESLDRLSRESVSKARKRLEAILEHGVDVYTLSDNEHYKISSLDDSMHIIKGVLLAQRAHEESELKSSRMKEVWSHKRELANKSGKILSSACPRWLEVNSDRTAFIFTEHLDTVKRIFKLRLDGYSMSNIAQALNVDLTPTFKNHIGKWNQSTVQQLLCNPATYGLKVPSRKTVVTGVEPIHGYYTVKGKGAILESDFNAVQQLSSDKVRSPAGDNPLSTNILKGVLVCKHCSASVIMSSVTKGKMGYYVCSLRRLKRCNTAQAVRRDITDAAIVRGLIYKAERLLAGSSTEKANLKEFSAKRDNLVASRDMLVTLLLDNRITQDNYNSRYDGLAVQINKMSSEIASEQQRISSSTNIPNVLSLNLDDKPSRVEMNLIVRKLIKKIYLDGNNKTCDIEMHSGYKLINFPLGHLTEEGDITVNDAERWIEIMHIAGIKEHTFTAGDEFIPSHDFPQWVKDNEG